MTAGTNKNSFKKTRLRTLASRRGVSLVIVLWVMALLMVIVTEFAFTMRVESGAVRNFKDETSARFLAVAGVNAGAAEIAGEYHLVALDSEGRLVFLRREGGEMKRAEAKREFGLGDGRVSYVIEDEKGKLNLNTSAREALFTLLRLTGVEAAERDIIADSILDWRDPNTEFHRLNGAKDDYYRSLPKPYSAKNGPFDTVEELMLVRGVTPDLFYGKGKVPPEFGSRANSAETTAKDFTGIAKHLTVKGDGRININTAAGPVLEAVLGKGRAGEIMLRRGIDGYFHIPAYGGVLSSDTFSIRSIGEVNGIRVAVRAVLERKPGSGVTVSCWNDEGTVAD